MNLHDKTVVITGAASGLGLELTKILFKEGAKVVASDLNEEKLKNIPAGIAALSISADVTKEDEMKNLASSAISKFGRIDLWINNAGVWISHSRIGELDMEHVRRMFDVNVFGLIYGCRVALPIMSRQNEGVIVNIISVSALEIHLNSAAYAASKFAAAGFTKGLRLEAQTYESENVKIISVYPPAMKTDIYRTNRPANFDSFLAPEEVAALIVDNLALNQPQEELIIRHQPPHAPSCH